MVDDRFKALFASFIVEFFRPRIGHADDIARGLDHGHLHAQTDAEIRDFIDPRIFCSLDFTFGAAFAKSTGDEDCVEPFKVGRCIFGIKNFGIDPRHVYLNAVGHAAMCQRLFEGLIGIFQLGVFADNRNVNFAVGGVNAVINIVPDLQVGLGRGRDVERVQHRLIEALFVIGKRRFVDRFQIIGRNDGVFAHIAKQRDFFAFLVGDRVFGSADQNIGCDADGLQFLDRVLRRFGF